MGEVEEQERLLSQSQEQTERLRIAADLLVGAEFVPFEALDFSEDDVEDEEARGPQWKKIQQSEKRLRELTRKQAALEVDAYFDGDVQEFDDLSALWRNGQPTFHWPLEFPEVFANRSGFDAFVGNPPFIGAMRIAPVCGDEFQRFLKVYWNHRKGAADIIAYFFLRAFELLRQSGSLGLIATNTLTQGNTRLVGLDHICSEGGEIYRANKSARWPGTANVFISITQIHKGAWSGRFHLDGRDTDVITSFLDDIPNASEPKSLLTLPCYASRGTTILGIGFVVSPEEADELRNANKRNSDVLFPYLNAVDFSSSPDLSASREAIQFFEWPLEKAQTYEEPFSIVYEKVRPQREKPQRQVHETCYWKFSDKRPELYRSIMPLDEALVCGMATKYFAFAFVPTRQVFADKVGVFATEDRGVFSVLSCSLHTVWALHYMYTLKGDPCYSLSACFQTFPCCTITAALRDIGNQYHERRRTLMREQNEGLTKTYNRFHDPDESHSDFPKLRDLQVEMDKAVADAFGWNDIALDHCFGETMQGVRFSISDQARREVLQRLLKLNHERYEDEVKQGLHDKKKPKRKRKKKQPTGPQLFE